MILETTYTNPEYDQIINDLVGKPYSILQRIKLKGIGSKRMIIDEVSPNMKQYLNAVSDLNYGNIELRPGGILIRINKGLRNFTWAIPYYHLVIYKTNGASIHAQGRYVHFRQNRTFTENKAFFAKMLDMKIENDAQYSFY
ncbi:MAG: hypothetical protein KJO49_10050 [Bacteroidia bacterium]|nr:hypothetical protein [Bacteroidia bacterium]MBT8267816.1 hypothetical protein [Bacteroidia bacterium]NNF81348.1 hypothetical protein [Flavobacteriaceae bacterium]NNK70137.1 hypothetical protein [Flavobacteriaceae bacterium]NNL78887.1 hypothetical protein [Flavobacteriaceae bacterium]